MYTPEPVKCNDAPRANVPVESVEMKLNIVGERICQAANNVRECLKLMFGADVDERPMIGKSNGLYGLAEALEDDSRALLNIAEELRKRCGG